MFGIFADIVNGRVVVFLGLEIILAVTCMVVATSGSLIVYLITSMTVQSTAVLHQLLE